MSLSHDHLLFLFSLNFRLLFGLCFFHLVHSISELIVRLLSSIIFDDVDYLNEYHALLDLMSTCLNLIRIYNMAWMKVFFCLILDGLLKLPFNFYN